MPEIRAAGEAEAVHVPLFDGSLAPVPEARRRKLLAHLVETLRNLRRQRDVQPAPHVAPPQGALRQVTQAACALCGGWCCKAGDNDGYLDERSLARVRCDFPEMSIRDLLRAYLDRVPAVSFQNSCIFHGKSGCTLERSLRSELCSRYYCNGLDSLRHRQHLPERVVVVSEEEGARRKSEILVLRS